MLDETTFKPPSWNTHDLWHRSPKMSTYLYHVLDGVWGERQNLGYQSRTFSAKEGGLLQNRQTQTERNSGQLRERSVVRVSHTMSMTHSIFSSSPSFNFKLQWSNSNNFNRPRTLKFVQNLSQIWPKSYKVTLMNSPYGVYCQHLFEHSISTWIRGVAEIKIKSKKKKKN